MGRHFNGFMEELFGWRGLIFAIGIVCFVGTIYLLRGEPSQWLLWALLVALTCVGFLVGCIDQNQYGWRKGFAHRAYTRISWTVLWSSPIYMVMIFPPFEDGTDTIAATVFAYFVFCWLFGGMALELAKWMIFFPIFDLFMRDKKPVHDWRPKAHALTVVQVEIVEKYQNITAKNLGNITRDDAMQILELKEPFTQDELKTRWREMLKRTHPDTGGSTLLTRLVNAAYEDLKK